MCNPPLLDERTGRRASSLGEAANLFADLVAAGVRTICFARSRRSAELIYQFARNRLEDAGDHADRVTPYRAGYTPQQRRDIERRLASGELLGVVTTNALELGIDIGHLDAAMSVTFPGTVASLRQQWGRAGRTERGGLAMYVAGDDALDQFFCRHPEEFLDRPVEAAILDHTSETIYMRHLLAAAYEAPLDGAGRRDPRARRSRRRADRLVAAGELRKRDGRWLLRGADFPAGRLSLRSASTD